MTVTESLATRGENNGSDFSVMFVSAGEAAAGALECSAVDKIFERCHPCGDTSTYQTSTSGVVAGAGGDADAGYSSLNTTARVGSAKPFAAVYNQLFVQSVVTKDMSDEKGQARNTRLHVTL